MLFSRNAVYSALFLVLNFVTVAVFYLLLGAPFIAMSQITVYAGAIMVLVPLRDHAARRGKFAKSTSDLPWQKPLALLASRSSWWKRST
jgi:NADH-quinone oxidoreductase subunit J